MSLRDKIEAVVFAGLKPRGGQPRNSEAVSPPAPAPSRGWLRERIDLWISGGADPSDPLYLSNRTAAQKLRAWSVVVVPLVVLVAGGALILTTVAEGRRETKAAKELSPAEFATKLLPNLKDIKIESNHDVDVLEVRVERDSGGRLSGAVKNNTNRPIARADVTCELTDPTGTQVGSVIAHVDDIPPGGTRTFSMPLGQSSASYALVRDIAVH